MLFDLDMACVQFHSGLDMLYTVQEAMAERPDKQTAYADALYGVYDYLKMVEHKITGILEDAGKEVRE